MLVDSHCHLYFKDFDGDRDEVFRKARNCGVEVFVNVGVDEKTSLQALKLATEENGAFATVGLHPHAAHLADDRLLERLDHIVDTSPRIIAIGEVGLDYFKSQAGPDRQKEVFSGMARLAIRKNLPLVIHSRDALNDTLKVLVDLKGASSAMKAVFHCFSYDRSALEKILERGFLVSFTGNVTFPNARRIQEAAREVPLDRFMLETDSPYMAPQAVRGKRNEPAFLRYLVEKIAGLKGIEPAEVAKATTENARAFYGLDVQGGGLH